MSYEFTISASTLWELLMKALLLPSVARKGFQCIPCEKKKKKKKKAWLGSVRTFIFFLPIRSYFIMSLSHGMWWGWLLLYLSINKESKNQCSGVDFAICNLIASCVCNPFRSPLSTFPWYNLPSFTSVPCQGFFREIVFAPSPQGQKTPSVSQNKQNIVRKQLRLKKK